MPRSSTEKTTRLRKRRNRIIFEAVPTDEDPTGREYRLPTSPELLRSCVRRWLRLIVWWSLSSFLIFLLLRRTNTHTHTLANGETIWKRGIDLIYGRSVGLSSVWNAEIKHRRPRESYRIGKNMRTLIFTLEKNSDVSLSACCACDVGKNVMRIRVSKKHKFVPTQKVTMPLWKAAHFKVISRIRLQEVVQALFDVCVTPSQ